MGTANSHAFNLNTQKEEARGSLWVSSKPTCSTKEVQASKATCLLRETLSHNHDAYKINFF